MENNLILYSVPFFFALILVELVAGFIMGRNTYRLNDSIVSIGSGIMSQVTDAVTKLIRFALYAVAYQHFRVFDMPSDSWVTWVVAFILFDFFYYWYHRFAHEINILWATHVIHHSSEDYNLGTALRQPSTGFWVSWVFYIPMAILGIPLSVFITVNILNLLYQYWVHTQLVGKLGWYEAIFVTPSNHRVHHGQNKRYLDRNYGGVFILWDRWFGTFQEELDEEKVIYGIRSPIHSWNPVWANVHFYVQLWRDAVHTQNLWDKMRIWFMPTGWRPDDVKDKYPITKTDLEHFEKFDIPISSPIQWFAAIQFLFVLGATLLLMAEVTSLPLFTTALGAIFISFWLYSLSTVLERHPQAKKMEWTRIALTLIMVLGLSFSSLTTSGYLQILLLSNCIVSVLCLIMMDIETMSVPTD